MLLQMALFHSFFVWLGRNPMYIGSTSLFICWWTFILFPSLGIINSAAMNTGVHISFHSFLQLYAQEWDCWIIWKLYF